MMDVLVRRIRDEDAGLLRELRLRSLTDAPEAFGQTAEEASARADEEWRQQVRAAATGDRRAWYVAETGSPARAIGLVNGRRRPPDDLMVFSMWVEPESRRVGVGRDLLGALDDWASAWGAKRTILWVFAGNEQAIRFYQRLGFAVQAGTPDAEIGRSYGALAMSRSTGRPP
jgi:RimJ/RimL family protein N-acetyltransferase